MFARKKTPESFSRFFAEGWPTNTHLAYEEIEPRYLRPEIFGAGFFNGILALQR